MIGPTLIPVIGFTPPLPRAVPTVHSCSCCFKRCSQPRSIHRNLNFSAIPLSELRWAITPCKNVVTLGLERLVRLPSQKLWVAKIDDWNHSYTMEICRIRLISIAWDWSDSWKRYCDFHSLFLAIFYCPIVRSSLNNLKNIYCFFFNDLFLNSYKKNYKCYCPLLTICVQGITL